MTYSRIRFEIQISATMTLVHGLVLQSLHITDTRCFRP